MIRDTRNWRLAILLMLVSLAATPAFAQLCTAADSGNPLSQLMLDRRPDCGGTAPIIPPQPQLGGGSITTIFAADNAFAGNTFDVEVLGGTALNVVSFDMNIEVGASPPDKTVTVYYREGTSVGVENDPLSWTMLGSESGITAAGTDVPTPVAVGGLTMEPGQVYGFYVDLTSYDGGDAMLYTNGGPNVFSNPDIQVTTNTGQAAPAFSGSFFPRQWNGTLYYEQAGPVITVLDVPTLNVLGLFALLAGLGGAGLAVIRRRNNA